MNNVLELKPNIIIGDNYTGFLILDIWKGFQSRKGDYGMQDTKEKSDGQVKVIIEGVPVDYIKLVSEAQVSAIKYLAGNQEMIRHALLNDLLNEYPTLKGIYEEYIPDISDTEQFKELLGISNLHVLSAEKDGYAYIGFEFGCIWDEEHGLGIMMHKDRVLKIGFADTSFDSWIAYDDNGTTDLQMERIFRESTPYANFLKPRFKLTRIKRLNL